MRTDMNHVVLQGGAAGKFRPFEGRAVRGHRTSEGFEPLEVGRVRMKVRTGRWDDACHNVTFAPIRRWLASQVGRLWSEVNAELSSRHLPALQQSLREWVADEVARNCYRESDGSLCFGSRFSGVQPVTWNDYYVDPVSGLLCKSVNERVNWYKANRVKREAARAEVFRKGAGDVQYHKRDGVWYEVHVASYSEKVKEIETGKEKASFGGVRIFDTFLKEGRPRFFSNSDRARALYGNADLYAVSHRVLGRRDLHRLNLN